MASPLINFKIEGLSQLNITSSSLGTTTTETLPPVTFTDSVSNVNGSITVTMVIFILIIVIISLVVVCFKRIRRSNQANAAVHTVIEAYGVVLQDMITSTEDSAYSYPSVDPASSLSIEARQNEAYATNAAVHTVTMTNEAYGVVLQDTKTSTEDSAYSYPSVDPVSSLSIEAKQNEAYATNVAAQRNVAYGAATVATGESHEFGMYDYIIL